jgi:preprotein translocase subunit SecD
MANDTNQQIQRSRVSIISLLLGILALAGSVLFFFSDVFVTDFFVSALPIILLGILATVLGHISFRKVQRSNGRLKGKKSSLSGLILGYLSIAFLVLQFTLLALHSHMNPPNYEVVVQLQESPETMITPTLLDKAEKIISTRLNYYRVPHNIQKKNSNSLIIQIRVTESFQEQSVLSLFENRVLSFHLVHQENAALVRQMSNLEFTAPRGFRSTIADGETLFVETKPLLIDNVEDAEAIVDPSTSTPAVLIQFNPEGAERFAQITKDNVGRRLAISIDDKIYSAPTIRDPITKGKVNISGIANQEEARIIELALKAGRIPVPIRVIDHHFIKQ